MPVNIKFPTRFGPGTKVDLFYAREFPVATEEELLEFVNKGRAAGAAEILEELLPSLPKSSSECLIANGLNFGCRVAGPANTMISDSAIKKYGSDQNLDRPYRYFWYMYMPHTMNEEQARTIADALSIEYHKDSWNEISLGPLPPHIGNTADAFDLGLAFQEYRKYREYRE